LTLLVTGGDGQLGSHLAALPGVTALGRSELDVCDPTSVDRALHRHQPTAVIHAAAFTHVDGCTTHPARAYRVNAGGTELVARSCARRGIRLLHISTDYVLHGPDTPGHRLPLHAPTLPLNAYGRSKWAGEQAAAAHGATIVRVQWVYHRGGAGFVNRALLRMQAGEAVPLVTDQVGSPTPAPLLAGWLHHLAGCPTLPPVIHLATRGEATPDEWVCALARASGIHPRSRPISRTHLPGAPRPARSCLAVDASEALLPSPIPHWHDALLALF